MQRGDRMQKLHRITLSFKQTTRDVRLFTIINSKEEKSDYIKNCIEYYEKHSIQE